MLDELELLSLIKSLTGSGSYRVRLHAVRHMIEEGFSEENMIEAITGRSRIIEHYPEEERCLILGYFAMTESTRLPLHLICDYSQEGVVDIVTAYIPQKPWWTTPTLRGKMK